MASRAWLLLSIATFLYVVGPDQNTSYESIIHQTLPNRIHLLGRVCLPQLGVVGFALGLESWTCAGLYWLLGSSALVPIDRLGCQTKFLPKIPKKLPDEVSSQHRDVQKCGQGNGCREFVKRLWKIEKF